MGRAGQAESNFLAVLAVRKDNAGAVAGLEEIYAAR